MYLELAAGAYLLGQYIYHRVTAKDPPDPSDRIEVPKVDEGQTVPLFFGRVRIRKPFIAWHGGATAAASGLSPTGKDYSIRILFVVGRGFFDGTMRLRDVFWGDRSMASAFEVPPNLGGTPYLFEPQPLTSSDQDFAVALVEFGDGHSTQDLGALGTMTRSLMVTYGVAPETIPGFRGVATLFMDISKWTTYLPDIDVEMSVYPASTYYTSFIPLTIGDDANPVDVIAALLCDQTQHGLDPGEVIDQVSFRAAAETLLSEGLGISITWEDRRETRDMINDVLKHIDGVLWKDEHTGLWHIKLIRPDYDPNSAPELNPSNCRITNFASGGWVDTPNAVRVLFTDRSDDYRENSAVAQNPANAVGQGGERIEVVKRFAGITTKENAERVAARELAWESRPLMKCTAIASRAFEEITPGSVVRLTYPDLGIANRLMRVGNVSPGTTDTNNVRLDLIEDVFYVWRGRVHTGGVTPFPTPPILDPG